MSRKRKIDDQFGEVTSSPIATAYGFDDEDDNQPERKSPRRSPSESVMHDVKLRSPDQPTNNNLVLSNMNLARAMANATSALDPANIRLVSSGSASKRVLAEDSRCYNCAIWERTCDMAKTCANCKLANKPCAYPPDDGVSHACLQCGLSGLTGRCDLKKPQCSLCRQQNKACKYPDGYSPDWCVACRQPGRICDLTKPKCSLCRRYHRKCAYTRTAAVESPAPDSSGDEEEYEVESILACRSRSHVLQYLVKWKGYEETTWEPENNLEGAAEAIAQFRSQQEPKKSSKLGRPPKAAAISSAQTSNLPPHPQSQAMPAKAGQAASCVERQRPGPSYTMSAATTQLLHQPYTGQISNERTTNGASPIPQMASNFQPAQPILFNATGYEQLQPVMPTTGSIEAIRGYRFDQYGYAHYLVQYTHGTQTWVPSWDLHGAEFAINAFHLQRSMEADVQKPNLFRTSHPIAQTQQRGFGPSVSDTSYLHPADKAREVIDLTQPEGTDGDENIQSSDTAAPAKTAGKPTQSGAKERFMQVVTPTAMETFAQTRTTLKHDKYLVVPKDHREGRPLPNGPYTRHTVASSILLACGQHPWLVPLNYRLQGIIDKNTDGTLIENAREQAEKAAFIHQTLAQRAKGNESSSAVSK